LYERERSKRNPGLGSQGAKQERSKQLQSCGNSCLFMTSKTSDTEVEKTQKGVEPKVNVDDEPV
jgi:hypothetical protein